MNRWELASQLRHRLSGKLSEEELSRWALRKIVENDNLRPPLPVAEHDLLQEVLEQCAVAVEPGQLLTKSEIRAFIRGLTSSDP